MKQQPGTNGGAACSSRTMPLISVTTFRWKKGGRNVPSVASQRGANTMRSRLWAPASSSGADRREVARVVDQRRVVAVPGDDVEGRVVLAGLEEAAAELGDDPEVGREL